MSGLSNLGYVIHWIDVKPDMTWDIDLIERHLQSGNISAVICCDFFGMSNPQLTEIASLKARHDFTLVRDCCHSPLTWAPGQPEADVVFFSFRKLIPVTHGGALLDSSPNVFQPPHFSWKDIHRGAIGKIEFLLNELSFINPYPIRDFFGHFADFVPHSCSMTEINLSRTLQSWLGSPERLAFVAERRRENFFVLARLLAPLGLSPAINIGNQNDVPQVFPLTVSNPADLVAFLRRMGIGACQWPANEMPSSVLNSRENYPCASELYGSIACLPVHQDLNSRQLYFIQSSIETYLKQGARRV